MDTIKAVIKATGGNPGVTVPYAEIAACHYCNGVRKGIASIDIVHANIMRVTHIDQIGFKTIDGSRTAVKCVAALVDRQVRNCYTRCTGRREHGKALAGPRRARKPRSWF